MVVSLPVYDRGLFVGTQQNDADSDSSLKEELDALIAYDRSVLGFLMESSLDGLWIWDLETPRRGWMSDRFWELLGHDPTDGTYRAADWDKLLHPDGREQAVTRFAAFCANPERQYDEILKYRHRGGSPVWMRCRGLPLRDISGKPVRLIGAHNDITALKRTEEELLRGKDELVRSLVKSAESNVWLEMAEQIGRVGHWRISLPDLTLVWSNEVYRIYGVNPQTYTPDLESAIAFYHPEDRPEVEAAVRRAIDGDESFEFSLRIVTLNGALRHVHCRGETRRGADGVTTTVVGVLADISEQKQLEQALRQANVRLEELANIDPLTGLANRRRFDEMLAKEWLRAGRDQTPLSLVMLDIDRFKGFNDRYGHVAGDECLRRVAGAVALYGRRPGDVAARYGGEEMALLLPATNAIGAETVARECRSAIAGLGVGHDGNMSCGGIVTASFGVATTSPPEDSAIPDWTSLIAQADRLLYEAKRLGRNRVVTASGASGPTAPREVDEEARLAALAQYDAAGATGRSQELDKIARLAATLTGVPIALVSLVGRDTQQFAGNYGLPGVVGTHKDISFCAHTILGDEPMVVADAHRDVRFKENPLVTGDPGIRFYAGAPIVSPTTHHKLGAICIIDTTPHEATSTAERALLTDLAGMVGALLEDGMKTKEGLLF